MKYGAYKYSQKLLDETKQVWLDEAAAPLSDKEAVEIIDNTIALFELLAELDDKYGKA